MTKTKMTKRDYFETLSSMTLDAVAAGLIDEETSKDLVVFIDKEIDALDKRAANAKKYASKRKAEADELTEIINTTINETGQAMTIPEIVADVLAAYPDCGITPQKATYRLNKLVEDGILIKDQVSIKEDGKPARKINCYAPVQEVEAE